MPQLEGPMTENIQLCTGGLWEEKGKIKSLKKKKGYILDDSIYVTFLERQKYRGSSGAARVWKWEDLFEQWNLHKGMNVSGR